MTGEFERSNRGSFVAHTLKLSVGEYGLRRLNSDVSGAIKAEGWLTINEEGHQVALDLVLDWDEVIAILGVLQDAGDRVRAQIMTGRIAPRGDEPPADA